MMNVVRFGPIFLLCIVLSACSKGLPEKLNAPDGALKVETLVVGEEAGSSQRYCVKLVFYDDMGNQCQFQTAASDIMKWSVAWHDHDTLVMWSADIGIYSYDIIDWIAHRRKASAAEVQTARESCKEKYGEYLSFD